MWLGTWSTTRPPGEVQSDEDASDDKQSGGHPRPRGRNEAIGCSRTVNVAKVVTHEGVWEGRVGADHVVLWANQEDAKSQYDIAD